MTARPPKPEPHRASQDDAPTLARLQDEVQRLRDAIDCMPTGVSVFDGDDRLVMANARYLELWGLPAELGRPGTSYADIMAATRAVESPATAQSAPEPGSVGTRRREWRLEGGRIIEVHVSRRADGSCVALHEDVTEQRRALARTEFLARHDGLTGLPNREVLHEALAARLEAMTDEQREEVALLCIDLDRFKPVNDMFGHAAGDQVLRTMADRLRGCIRGSDLLVRLGGDEFALLQVGAPQPAGSTALARRLLDALAAAVDVGGQPVHVGGSIGIAIAPFDGTSVETLLRNADLALYRAKADGGGTLRYFEPEMNNRAHERRGLEADLRTAIGRGGFTLVYQPQLDLEGGHVVGIEALLRWPHPRRGLLMPDAFIDLAEETGLIVPMGRWVLERACRDAARWPEHVRLAVNISAAHFRHGSLLVDVAEALDSSGLPAHRLELEITESVMLSDARQAIETLGVLRARGVRIAMDDFGTGYSSLSYLRSFPFDRIKIDRSFVRDLSGRPEHLAIVRAIVELGHALGMQTTAEGIETWEQLHAIRAQGCAEVQGFLFSQPRPAEEIPSLIAALSTDPGRAADSVATDTTPG